MRISVKTVNDGWSDFDYLFELWSQVQGPRRRITFDFTECRFLRQNAVAFLGGLARLIAYRSGNVSFAWNTLHENVRTNLAQNGFLEAFGEGEQPWTGNAIPYREDSPSDEKQIAAYLRNQWLGRSWVAVSPLLRDEIVSRVVEIYDNAFVHAHAPIAVVSCGQHYPHLQRLSLTVVDFGIGIPASVRAYLGNPELSAADSIAWALQRGTTTKPSSISRGLGLDLLATFVKTNKGRLEIFSGGGYAVITEYAENTVDRGIAFAGAMINITLECDERYYCLDSEPTDGPLF
jgi:signal transduction histidine kinase